MNIEQRTPVRVLHRRAPLVRDKTVHSLRVVRRFSAAETRIAQGATRWALLEVVASGGTYIKEFVHGDLGRTRPSVASLLGCAVDIIQLDVVGLEEEGTLDVDDGRTSKRPRIGAQ